MEKKSVVSAFMFVQIKRLNRTCDNLSRNFHFLQTIFLFYFILPPSALELSKGAEQQETLKTI